MPWCENLFMIAFDSRTELIQGQPTHARHPEAHTRDEPDRMSRVNDVRRKHGAP